MDKCPVLSYTLVKNSFNVFIPQDFYTVLRLPAINKGVPHFCDSPPPRLPILSKNSRISECPNMCMSNLSLWMKIYLTNVRNFCTFMHTVVNFDDNFWLELAL